MSTSQSFSVNKLSQKGVAHIFLVIILLVGIISGVYLVQKTQIFKPKAYEIQDVPAESVQPSEEDYADWVTQMHSFGIYPAKEDNEVILYNRAQFVEKYCQPQGCILNPSTTQEIMEGTNSDVEVIKDLGVKLKENGFAPLTVLKQYFPDIINIDKSLYLQLEALEPICRLDPEGLVCRPGDDLYKREISQQDLEKYITQVATERGLSEKDPLKRLINFSDPIFGTKALISWATLPPNEVSDEERISVLFTLASLPVSSARTLVRETGRASLAITRPIMAEMSSVRTRIISGQQSTLSALTSLIRTWLTEVKTFVLYAKIPQPGIQNTQLARAITKPAGASWLRSVPVANTTARNQLVQAMAKEADLGSSAVDELGRIVASNPNPAIMQRLEQQFGPKLAEGLQAVVFRDGGVVTKIFRFTDDQGLKEYNQAQIDFYRRFGGREGIPAFGGLVADIDGRIIGFRQQFIDNAMSLEAFYNSGGRLRPGEAQATVDSLSRIHRLTGVGHGDLVHTNEATTGIPGMNSNNVLVQTVNGRHTLYFIDWLGVPDLFGSPQYIATEYELFSNLIKPYIAR